MSVPSGARARAAAAYALTATSWSSSTYRSAWRSQLHRTSGDLRRGLRRAPPARPVIEGLRTEGTSRVSALLRVRETAAGEVLVQLDELRLSARRRERSRAWYRVCLMHRRDRWRVTGFTAVTGEQQ